MSVKIILIFIGFLFPSFTLLAAAVKAPIIIGLDADLSAVAKAGGVAIQRGAQIAIEEINQNGGVLGRTFQLESRDHRGNPSRGLVNIEYFGSKKDVIAVLGGVHTPVALNELPLIHELELIYLGPWAAGTTVVSNGYQPNYVFRVSIRDNQAGKVLMKEAKRSGFEKVALLLERTGWGNSNERSMKAAAKALGINIIAVEWFNWREDDVTQQVDAIVNAGAEAVMLVANAPEGVVVAKHFGNLAKDKRIPIISHWGISGGNFVKKLGLEMLNGLDIRVIQTYSFLNPSNKQKNQFVLDRYHHNFNPKVTALTMPAAVGVAHAYDLVHLLAIAIEQANSTDRAKVRDALEKLPSYRGLVKNYSPAFTDTQHDALLEPDYQMMKYDDMGYLEPLVQGQ